MLDGKRACFSDDGSDVGDRLLNMSIHPTGPLWGDGEALSTGKCLQIEQAMADKNGALSKGLQDARLKQERRALRLVPKGLSWVLEQDDVLCIEFELPAGTFATMLLRELLTVIPSEQANG